MARNKAYTRQGKDSTVSFKNYSRKLDGLIKIAKPYGTPEKVLLLKDSDGWTDGYIADLTNINIENIKAKAILKGLTIQEEKSKCPEIKKIINKSRRKKSHEVEDFEYDLVTGNAKLINSKVTAYVNLRYIRYFHDAWKNRGGIDKLVLTEELEPVRVYVAKEIVGLIMPVRVAK